MSTDKKIKKINQVVQVLEEMAPYMPPLIKGTEYLFLNKDELYMITPEVESVYTERLAALLKEECRFIKEVYFITKEEK